MICGGVGSGWRRRSCLVSVLSSRVLALRAIVLWGVMVAFVAAACGCASHEAPREIANGGGCDDCGGDPSSAGAVGVGGETGGAAGADVGVEPAGAGGASGGEAGGGPVDAAGQAGETSEVAPDLALRALTISQSVEINLVDAGREVAAASRTAPIVAGKRALLRAFVDTRTPFRPRSLLAVLDIDTGPTTRSLVSERTITASSSPDDASSAFVFQVAAADLTPNSRYRLRVLEKDTTPLVQFPDVGYAELSARSLPAFQLVIVPFIVGGYTPKTGEIELDALRRRLVALYPSVGVDITRAPPVTLSYPVDAEGEGWDEALDEIYSLRAAARPAPDVFYFGMMAPGPSFDAFCPDGCTVGYSVVADVDDADSRGSIGVGVFPDGSGADDAWDTLAHELGHALGRQHAPCPAPPSPNQPDGIDRRWPSDMLHASAALGAYAYDFDTTRWIKPRQAKDVMSYCTPIWISDYTYRGIFERLDSIQNESFRVLDGAARQLFRLARINRDGRATWLGDRYKHGHSSERAVALLDADGTPLGEASAQVAFLDHARGGYVWLPERELRESGAVSVDLRPLGGSVLGL